MLELDGVLVAGSAVCFLWVNPTPRPTPIPTDRQISNSDKMMTVSNGTPHILCLLFSFDRSLLSSP